MNTAGTVTGTNIAGYTTADSWPIYYPNNITVGTAIVSQPQIITTPDTVIADYQSPSGVKGKIGLERTAKGIHPRLYFSYVKSKLNKIEKEKLAKRIDKLRSMVVSADDMDQQALYESLSLMLAVAIRESEAYVCGFSRWIERKSIDKFIYAVRERTVKFEELEKFPRVIPEKVRVKIRNCKNKNLFDDYWILYTDYTKEVLKTTKEKVREKDPIVFGRFSYQENILYPIGDWVDEYCDITLEKVVEKLRKDDPLYQLNEVPEMSEKSIQKLLAEVKVRHDRLKGTNASNYKDNMVKEDKDKINRLKDPNFWNKLWDKFRRQ